MLISASCWDGGNKRECADGLCRIWLADNGSDVRRFRKDSPVRECSSYSSVASFLLLLPGGVDLGGPT